MYQTTQRRLEALTQERAERLSAYEQANGKDPESGDVDPMRRLSSQTVQTLGQPLQWGEQSPAESKAVAVARGAWRRVDDVFTQYAVVNPPVAGAAVNVHHIVTVASGDYETVAAGGGELEMFHLVDGKGLIDGELSKECGLGQAVLGQQIGGDAFEIGGTFYRVVKTE